MKHVMRVKQLADQTFSRSGKPEALSDELQAADRKVEHLKTALHSLCKRLGPTGGVAQAQDPAAREKRLKKLPEYTLGLAMQEASNFEEESLLKYVLQECARTEISLANEIAEHDVKVEQLVSTPLTSYTEQDLPNILKAKKHLTRLLNEKENAASRHQYLLRQGEQNSTKTSQAREEAEEAEVKADQSRDALAAEMFALLAKETELANTILQYVKLQRAYHESALHTLTDIVPHLEKFINDSNTKPVFGFPLEEHLRVTNRTIAYPIEICVCALHELGLSEEGLLRIAAGSSRMKRMKLSLDSGIFSVPFSPEYRDVHVIGGVLKSYLRELPEPLLTHRLHDSFLAAVSKNFTEETRLNALWEVIHLLPTPNLNNLKYLIKFLSVLTKNQAVNKMTPSNIAIVIAPNLLWDSDDAGFSMSNATTVNCIVELLVKHADWFFKDDVNFFITYTREDLFPDLCEYGFTPNFGQGVYNQGFNPVVDQQNGDHNMSKSLNDYTIQNTLNPIKNTISLVQNKQSHSRSNSHDTSLILVDGDMKNAQSNSSLSDHSPPQGSPKPITRRKNKPVAPVPPNFTPPDKKNQLSGSVENILNKSTKADVDRPEKPPRPAGPESSKHITGVQTINRSTYKSKISKLANKFSGSKENLADTSLKNRRKSFEFESENLESESKQIEQAPITVKHPEKVSESTQTSATLKTPLSVKSGFVSMKQYVQSSPETSPTIKVPVAAPRTSIASLSSVKQENLTFIDPESGVEVQLRRSSGENTVGAKPAVPERPATLRPQSFRNSVQKIQSLETLIANEAAANQNGNNNGATTTLEKIHAYNVDKHQPTLIQVGNSDKEDKKSSEAPVENLEPPTNKNPMVRSLNAPSENQNKSEGIQSDVSKVLTSQMRKLSQSEGNILDVPPSPRPYHKPPRPQIPAPPPPIAAANKPKEGPESTYL